MVITGTVDTLPDMKTYWSTTAHLATATPGHRNRIVDFWRAVAIIVVVFGHWLAASIWLQPDGEIALLNSLEWVPYAGWVTWVVQVMPIFFLAGGYANAKSLTGMGDGNAVRRDWITTRVRRLFTPVVPLLLVWVALILVLRPFLPSEVVFAGAMAATVPLWFLAVYLVLIAAAPMTFSWWRRSGVRSIVGLAAAAVAIDLARFVLDVPGIGWINFIFVWAAVHQIGYWWAGRDSGVQIRPAFGWSLAAGALTLLIGLTWIGWYPVAMIGVPGAGLTNMAPPTAALLVLGAIQAGMIWGTQPVVGRLMAHPRAWHGVVAVSGVMMTVYLWHLSAMSLVAAAGLNTFNGVLFSIEPGTAQWWLTRPLWLLVLTTATGALVAIFARFEWRISTAPPPRHRRAVFVGVLLCAGSAAAVAAWGIINPDAVIHWSIPVGAIAGAAIIGAILKKTQPRRQSPAALSERPASGDRGTRLPA